MSWSCAWARDCAVCIHSAAAAVACCAVLCYAVLCYAVLCCALLCFALLCCAQVQVPRPSVQAPALVHQEFLNMQNPDPRKPVSAAGLLPLLDLLPTAPEPTPIRPLLSDSELPSFELDLELGERIETALPVEPPAEVSASALAAVPDRAGWLVQAEELVELIFGI